MAFLHLVFSLYQHKMKTLKIFKLTLNNGKIISYHRISVYAILLNRTHFLILSCIREKYGPFCTNFLICNITKSRHLEFSRLTDFE